MNVDTEGVTQPAPETTTNRIKRAKAGECISDFKSILDENNMTENAIKQQMIMHGIEFTEDSKKSELIMIVKSANWTDAVEDITIKTIEII